MAGRRTGAALAAVLVAAFMATAAVQGADPLALEPFVEHVGKAGSFPVVAGGAAATFLVEGAVEWPGVLRATGGLRGDVTRVTGQISLLDREARNAGKHVVVVGTVGKGGLVDALATSGKFDAKPLVGKWESFVVEVVTGPFPGMAGWEKVEQALVIAGSDKRGTIYGVYELSGQMGVSPWHWWADVPVRKNEEVWVKAGRFMQGEPSVKYRGFFLNDEAPDLTNWVREKYGEVPGRAGVANYGREFYARIFEAMLRMKGNYLWPAMWNNAFNEDDPENARLADEYGIVMGTSHQEPMIRAQKEWDRRHPASWNYFTDAQTLEAFWREGIRRNKSYESILTLGLRGANDTPMIGRGSTVRQNMDLLGEIIGVQRKMIGEELNSDVTKVPQLWCPYKEVLDYYNAGFRVPEDVTILWTDDNWGNLRRLPTAEERGRSGGAGIYYHFDYVGGPRNYKWINTNPIPKVWEQMTRAKAMGADRVWIVNVGHFKGLEFPMEYWMRLGWEGDRWTNANITAYTEKWAEREFGVAHAKEIADIISQYTRFNGRRKPELLEPGTYSFIHYQEAGRVLAEWEGIVAKAGAIRGRLPPEARDAFYQLVLFPAKACAQVSALYMAAGRNALYAQQGRASANEWAERVRVLFAADAALMDEFHKHNGGKWNHFMDQVHIGYTSWQDPPQNVMPRVRELTVPEGASMGVAVEGVAAAVGAEVVAVPRIDGYARQRRWVDVFRKGKEAFEFTAAASVPWLVVSEVAGRVDQDKRLWISVDWEKAPKGTNNGTVKVSRGGVEDAATIQVEVFNPESPSREVVEGFVESNGVVAMEAEHFVRAVPAGDVRWERIDGYGKTLSAMTILPMTAGSVAVPGAGKSPWLEYKVHTFLTGEARVWLAMGASLSSVPGQALRVAVSIDEEAPQVVTVVPANAPAAGARWENSVKDNGYYVSSTHRIAQPGPHTVKVWMVDAGVVLERVVVDFGGLKASYLGPVESFRGR